MDVINVMRINTMASSSLTYKSSTPLGRPSSLNLVQSRLSIVYATLLLQGARNMTEANVMIDTPAHSALLISGADAEDVIECAGSWPRHDEGSGDTEELRYVAFPLPCHLLPYFRS